MKPGPIQFATRALGAPEGWDRAKHGDCDVLEIRDRNGTMESAWFPTDEEKAAIAAGRPVILTVWGSAHPPVAVNVPAFEATVLQLEPGASPPEGAVDVTTLTDERSRYYDARTGATYVGDPRWPR